MGQRSFNLHSSVQPQRAMLSDCRELQFLKRAGNYVIVNQVSIPFSFTNTLSLSYPKRSLRSCVCLSKRENICGSRCFNKSICPPPFINSRSKTVMANNRFLHLVVSLILIIYLSGCLAAIPAGGLAIGLWIIRDKESPQEQTQIPEGQKPNPPVKKANPFEHSSIATVYNYAPIITLAWSANHEQNLAGYKIYYKSDSMIPPYDGAGLPEGESPIVIPLSLLKNHDDPQFTIHGLIKTKTYIFFITAYDKQGKESGFSNGILIAPLENNASKQAE
jgi:hypothetical protein